MAKAKATKAAATVINKDKNGGTTRIDKGKSVLEAMMQKDAKAVNALINRINNSNKAAFENWLKLGEFIVKWKRASSSKNEYGALIAVHIPKLDRRVINYVWKIKKYEEEVVIYRDAHCAHISHPRTVWTRFYQSRDEAVQDEMNKALGTERKQPSKPAKTEKTDKPASKDGSGSDRVTSQALTGAKEFSDRLKGFSMALNAITIDANNGSFTDAQKADMIKRLEACIKALRD
jgi:hypothetical protein